MTTSIIVLAVLAMAAYVLAFVLAAMAAWQSNAPPSVHPIVHQVLTVIGPALATYLGAQLGFTVSGGGSALQMLLTSKVTVSSVAPWIYVASLFGSAGVWLLRPNSTPDDLRQLAGSLIGVLLGGLSIVLGVK